MIAEGVETQEQADFLAYNGCDLFQGYLFHKPLPPEEAERILEGRHASAVIGSMPPAG